MPNHVLMMRCEIRSFRDHRSGESLDLAVDSRGGLRCWLRATQPRRKDHTVQPTWTDLVARKDLPALERELSRNSSWMPVPRGCESLLVSQPRAPCSLLCRAFPYILDQGQGVIVRALQTARPITTVGSLASEGLCPSALYPRQASEVIYVCDLHLCLPNTTPCLFEVDLCSAENSISQPLLKGGVVPRHNSSPWDASESPGCSFPIGSLLGVRFSWCVLLASHISLLSFFFFFGLNHRVMLKMEQLSWNPTVTRRRMDSWKCRRSLAPGGAGLHFPDFLLLLFDVSTIGAFFLLLSRECSAREHEGGLRRVRTLPLISSPSQ